MDRIRRQNQEMREELTKIANRGLGIFEDISRNGGYEQQAKVAVILRGMSSRSAWTMQLRHLPRHKSGHKTSSSNPGRPLPMEDQVAKKSFKSSGMQGHIINCSVKDNCTSKGQPSFFCKVKF